MAVLKSVLFSNDNWILVCGYQYKTLAELVQSKVPDEELIQALEAAMPYDEDLEYTKRY